MVGTAHPTICPTFLTTWDQIYRKGWWALPTLRSARQRARLTLGRVSVLSEGWNCCGERLPLRPGSLTPGYVPVVVEDVGTSQILATA